MLHKPVCAVCFAHVQPILHTSILDRTLNPAWCLQATGGRPRPGSTQYVPRDLTAAEKQRIIKSKGFNDFLEHIRPRWVYWLGDADAGFRVDRTF